MNLDRQKEKKRISETILRYCHSGVIYSTVVVRLYTGVNVLTNIGCDTECVLSVSVFLSYH